MITSSALRVLIASAFLLSLSCGDGGGAPPSDTGTGDPGEDLPDDPDVVDSDHDIPLDDTAPPDADETGLPELDTSGDTDVDSDVPVAECLNGVAEEEEECDLGDLRDADCDGLGLTPGVLTCGSDCTFRTGRCAACGDGRCEGDETSTTCAEDCAVVDIAAGSTHTCAVLADGSVRCWGGASGHQLPGLGDTSLPVPLPDIDDAVQVVAGAGHTCVLRASGAPLCWGRNGFGELGAGAASEPDGWTPTAPEGVPALRGLAAGALHTCGIAESDGAVWCWGRADYGALGLGPPAAASQPPGQIGALTAVDVVVAGRDHTCARTSANRVVCWGRNDQGQLGSGDRRWYFEPISASPSQTFLVGAGAQHSCATVINPAMPPQFSGLFCWGSNAYGQLAQAPTDDFLGPQRVAASRPDMIVGGRAHTCTRDGISHDVMCWGDNTWGQLGDGTDTSRHEPALVVGLAGVVKLSAGDSHTCAVLDDATARCWGRNDLGQLGDGSRVPHQPLPTRPVGL